MLFINQFEESTYSIFYMETGPIVTLSIFVTPLIQRNTELSETIELSEFQTTELYFRKFSQKFFKFFLEIYT